MYIVERLVSGNWEKESEHTQQIDAEKQIEISCANNGYQPQDLRVTEI